MHRTIEQELPSRNGRYRCRKGGEGGTYGYRCQCSSRTYHLPFLLSPGLLLSDPVKSTESRACPQILTILVGSHPVLNNGRINRVVSGATCTPPAAAQPRTLPDQTARAADHQSPRTDTVYGISDCVRIGQDQEDLE